MGCEGKLGRLFLRWFQISSLPHPQPVSNLCSHRIIPEKIKKGFPTSALFLRKPGWEIKSHHFFKNRCLALGSDFERELPKVHH